MWCQDVVTNIILGFCKGKGVKLEGFQPMDVESCNANSMPTQQPVTLNTQTPGIGQRDPSHLHCLSFLESLILGECH